MTLGKAFGITGLVFVHTANEVIGYADVKRPANAISKNIDVEAACSHQLSLEYWVARSSRAMTVSFLVSESASITT